MQAVAVAFVGCIGQQANWKTAMGRANHFTSANQQWRDMAAVHIFEVAIATEAGDDHGGIFFADAFAGEEAISSADDLGQGHSRHQLRIDHALQSGGKESGRNSFASYV